MNPKEELLHICPLLAEWNRQIKQDSLYSEKARESIEIADYRKQENPKYDSGSLLISIPPDTTHPEAPVLQVKQSPAAGNPYFYSHKLPLNVPSFAFSPYPGRTPLPADSVSPRES